jgi:threonylcarbamoyladenosine tRNA methylthiotransferase MtaB
MGRHWYTADTFERAIERVVDGRSTFALGADVIAGFPGETDADHAMTLAFVERLPFTYLHVFPYSERPDTAALRLPGRVPSDVAHRRARELREVGTRRADAYLRRREGGLADVVVVGQGPDREGLTEDFLTVDVDPRLPRGSRMQARLVMHGQRLLAGTLSPKFQ